MAIASIPTRTAHGDVAGAPTLYGSVLYVPVTSEEERIGADRTERAGT